MTLFRSRVLLITLTALLGLTRAGAQTLVSESPVAFSLQLHLTSEESVGPAPGEPESTLETTAIERVRFTHADLIATLRKNKTIPKNGRWKLVAVWADWPDADPTAGIGPRLYVREQKNKSPRAIRVPDKVASLSLSPRVRQQSPVFDSAGHLGSGREDYHALTRLTVRIGDLQANVLGLEKGRMLYRRTKPRAKRASLLLGRVDTTLVQGTGRLVRAKRHGIIKGSLSIAPGSFAPLTIFEPEPVPGHDYSGSNQYSGNVMIVGSAGLGLPPSTFSYPVVVCPVSMKIRLWTETTRRQPIGNGRHRTIASRQRHDFDETDVLDAALAGHDIADPTGWSLVACAREDDFADFADFDLMARHEDGTLLALSTPAMLSTVRLGESVFSPRLTASTNRAVRSARVTTAEGAATEKRRALIYGYYNQRLPFGDIKLNLEGLFDTRDLVTEEDILADPAESVVTHAATTATLIGTHNDLDGATLGIAQLQLVIGEALPGEHIYHEPAITWPIFEFGGSGILLFGGSDLVMMDIDSPMNDGSYLTLDGDGFTFDSETVTLNDGSLTLNGDGFTFDNGILTIDEGSLSEDDEELINP